MMLYICTKFHKNISKDFGATERKFQPNISSGSGEEAGFVIFTIFSNSSHLLILGYSILPNFTILKPWSQVMLRMKLENYRSSIFTEDI